MTCWPRGTCAAPCSASCSVACVARVVATCPGSRRIVDRLRERRQGELEQSNLEGVLDELAERVQGIVEQEREGIERRVAERGARGTGRGARRSAGPGPDGRAGPAVGPRSSDVTGWTRCRRTWPGSSTRLRDYEFMDPGARDAFNQLTDELRQQLLETFFQGLKEGVAGLSPEDLDGVRDMVRDLELAPREARLRRRYARRIRRVHGAATVSTSRRASATSTS